MKLLKEFWYGNIEPTEYDSDASKEYKEILRLISSNEEKLQATMGNSVLTVSGFFKQGATDTAADKMMKVLEAEAATQKTAI